MDLALARGAKNAIFNRALAAEQARSIDPTSGANAPVISVDATVQTARALRLTLPDLIKLDRYEARALARRNRAIRTLMQITSSRADRTGLAEQANFLQRNQELHHAVISPRPVRMKTAKRTQSIQLQGIGPMFQRSRPQRTKQLRNSHSRSAIDCLKSWSSNTREADSHVEGRNRQQKPFCPARPARNPVPKARFPANQVTTKRRFWIPNQRLGNSSTTTSWVLETVTLSCAESPALPDVSRARATIEWTPFATVVVSQLTLQGEVVSSLPPTATLSEALALIVIVPESGVDPVGAVIVAEGNVVSGVSIVALAGVDCPEGFAAASTARTV
jgi:hypothetical protein